MLIACVGGGLSACAMVTDYTNQGRPYAAEVAKEMAMAACVLPLSERKLNAEAVAEKLAKAGSPAIFTLDCDGDGKADF